MVSSTPFHTTSQNMICSALAGLCSAFACFIRHVQSPDCYSQHVRRCKCSKMKCADVDNMSGQKRTCISSVFMLFNGGDLCADSGGRRRQCLAFHQHDLEGSLGVFRSKGNSFSILLPPLCFSIHSAMPTARCTYSQTCKYAYM